MRSGRLFQNTLVVMAGTFASRVLGLVRQAVFNGKFPDELKDAFNVAFRVPNLFREILAEGAVQNALIPVLKSLPEREAKVFIRRFGAFLLGLNLIILGLVWAAAPWILRLLLSDQSYLARPEAFDQLVYLTRLIVPFLLGISLAALFTAVLQADERFGASSFSPLAFNLGSTALMLLFPGNPTALGLSVTIGGLLQALVQLPYLKGFGLEARTHPAIREALLRMGPFVFTTSLRQFLNLVLTNILSRYPTAALTGFYNAEVIFQMGLGLLAVSPAMALYPRFSGLGASGDKHALRTLLRSAVERVAVPLGLASALMVGLGPWIVVGLLGWFGKLTPENTAYSTQSLQAMGFALLPWGVNLLLLRAFYAVGEVGRAVRISSLVLTLNLAGYFLLRDSGLFVLNLATAVAGVVGLLLYLRRLELLRLFSMGEGLEAVGKTALCAIPAGLLAFFLARLFGSPVTALQSIPPLVVGGAAGLALYWVCARALGLRVRLRG